MLCAYACIDYIVKASKSYTCIYICIYISKLLNRNCYNSWLEKDDN